MIAGLSLIERGMVKAEDDEQPMMDAEAFANTLPPAGYDRGVDLFKALVPVLEKRRGKYWNEIVAEDVASERT